MTASAMLLSRGVLLIAFAASASGSAAQSCATTLPCKTLAEIARLLQELSEKQQCETENDVVVPETRTCDSLPCQNGGLCISTAINDYRCSCPENTQGDDCEVLLQCEPQTCGANAECFIGKHLIHCACQDGYTADLNGECRAGISYCPTNWTRFDNFCYKLFPIEETTFETAELVCNSTSDGHLASIHSELENKLIFELGVNASGVTTYLGAQNTGSVNGYKWVDGTPYNYTNWEPINAIGGGSQPDGDGKFVHMWLPKSGRNGWNDYLWGGPRLGKPIFFACKHAALEERWNYEKNESRE